jgi:hypothetical protein
MENIYYLNLLYKKVMELKKVLKDIENNDYSAEYKKYLISGYVITLDSILEVGISDLHSPELDELTSLIYYTRQKAVHYGYFNGMNNIQEIANRIVELTEANYQKELEFYSSIFKKSNFELRCNNVLIKNSPRITSTPSFYHFKSDDNSKEVWIPTSKIFTLTKKSKEKVAGYIIDLDAPVPFYTYTNGAVTSYKEIKGEELKTFFAENFSITEENYDRHLNAISSIISTFIADPINSMQIMEYASNEQYCSNTIDIIKDFIVERTMFDAYTEHYHLIKDKYSLNKMQKTDYTKLQNSFKKSVLQYITQKDAFFVEMTIKRSKYYFDNLKNHDSDLTDDPEILCTILIQLFETGPKHFSNQFISSSPEFKKCYTNLLRYRQIFSHYLLSGKERKEAITKFKNEFFSFVKILETINLDDVRITTHENYETYSLLERDKSDFFNYKHEQYLRVNDNTYIGKKIHYSSRNPKSNSLIAIIPYGNNASNTFYYKKDAYDYLRPVSTFDESTGKHSYVHVSKQALGDTKEVKIDFNLSNLFKAYSMLRKVKSNSEILINFPASEENEFYSHHDSLDNVILRFFTQGYLPVELLRRTKINSSGANLGFVSLTDEEGNIIANVINKKKYPSPLDSERDKKGFFSRIDDINHNFSRRRHSK